MSNRTALHPVDAAEAVVLIEAGCRYLREEHDRAIALGMDPLEAALALLDRARNLLAAGT